MSELRIRSEAMPEELWPETFIPRQASSSLDDLADDDFGPFLAAAARALAGLFGIEPQLLPGRPRPDGPQVAPALAALLATLRLGGEPARAGAADGASIGGVTLARHAALIATALEAVAQRVWPAGSRAPTFTLDIEILGISGHAQVTAPPFVPLPAPMPSSALAGRVLELPMRVRIELASEMAQVAALLPLATGTVLAITPSREMPLLLGDHRIGRAMLEPMPDGTQQATIVAIDVTPLGGRT